MLSLKQYDELKQVIDQIDDERDAMAQARVNRVRVANGSHIEKKVVPLHPTFSTNLGPI